MKSLLNKKILKIILTALLYVCLNPFYFPISDGIAAQAADTKKEPMEEIYSSANDKKSKLIKDVEGLSQRNMKESSSAAKHPDNPPQAIPSKFVQPTKKFEDRVLYNEGLKLYQDGKYEEAIAKLTEFTSFYPDGKYSENAFYLIADAYYNLARKDETRYQLTIDAYKSAASKFPKSNKREMALLRMGKLYAGMKFYIEAKASLKTLINEYPTGKYAPQSLIEMAEILMGEKKYKDAHRQLERVLVLYPFSTVVRDATFKIADSYYLEKDYIRAEELYREASKKWPTFPKANPSVMFKMGMTYFKNNKYRDSREVFFDLVNLFPKDALAIKAMAGIGDTYKIEGRERDAILMYSEALIRYPEGEDINSIKIKMANIGVERPELTPVSVIFDYKSYTEPMNTYQDIIEKHPSEAIAHEAMLRKGNLLAAESRYAEAVDTFKKLLSKYPEDKIAEESKASIRGAFLKMIDTYHSQKGFYTLLLTYYKNFDPYLKDIKDPKILYEIGDSYHQMGLYNKALETFDSALKYDLKGAYKGNITFKTGHIYYLQDKYSDAERQLRIFLRNYPGSEMANDAKWIIGDSLYNQKKFKEAISEYTLYIRKMPKNFKTAKVYYNLASSYKNIKSFQVSINLYKQAIEILKSLKTEDAQSIIVDAEYQILDLLFKTGRYVEAIETADRLAITYPDDKRTEWALYVAANSYEKLKKEDKSIVTLTKLAEIAEGKLFGNIASAEIKNLEWKNKYKEFYE